MSKDMVLRGGGKTFEVKEYQFPKGNCENTTLKINGRRVDAAFTTGRDKAYTYFRIDGGEFYVKGHLNILQAYELTLPEGWMPNTAKQRS